MPAKMKRIGWVVMVRPDSRYGWQVKKYTLTTKNEKECIGKYKYRYKNDEFKEGNARCVPVYVEVNNG